MTVRLANIGDTDRVLSLLADAHQHSPFAAYCDFSSDMWRDHWLSHLASSNSLCLVYEPNDVQGLFIVSAVDHPNAPLRICVEVVKWIDPSHRGGKAWHRMLRWSERWAKESGCVIASISGLECPGYKPVETHYVKVL